MCLVMTKSPESRAHIELVPDPPVVELLATLLRQPIVRTPPLLCPVCPPSVLGPPPVMPGQVIEGHLLTGSPNRYWTTAPTGSQGATRASWARGTSGVNDSTIIYILSLHLFCALKSCTCTEQARKARSYRLTHNFSQAELALIQTRPGPK